MKGLIQPLIEFFFENRVYILTRGAGVQNCLVHDFLFGALLSMIWSDRLISSIQVRCAGHKICWKFQTESFGSVTGVVCQLNHDGWVSS